MVNKVFLLISSGMDLGGAAKENKAPATAPKTTTVYLGGGITAEDEKALLDSATEALNIKIQSCGDFIRKLKQEKASKDAIGQEVKVLLLLKELYKKKTGQEWKPPVAAAEPVKEKKKEEVKPAADKPEG